VAERRKIYHLAGLEPCTFCYLGRFPKPVTLEETIYLRLASECSHRTPIVLREYGSFAFSPLVSSHKQLYFERHGGVIGPIWRSYIFVLYTKKYHDLPSQNRLLTIFVHEDHLRSQFYFIFLCIRSYWSVYGHEDIRLYMTQQGCLLEHIDLVLFVLEIHHNHYFICMTSNIVNKMHIDYFKIQEN
jgi:hypothetical protein